VLTEVLKMLIVNH